MSAAGAGRSAALILCASLSSRPAFSSTSLCLFAFPPGVSRALLAQTLFVRLFEVSSLFPCSALCRVADCELNLRLLSRQHLIFFGGGRLMMKCNVKTRVRYFRVCWKLHLFPIQRSPVRDFSGPPEASGVFPAAGRTIRRGSLSTKVCRACRWEGFLLSEVSRPVNLST